MQLCPFLAPVLSLPSTLPSGLTIPSPTISSPTITGAGTLTGATFSGGTFSGITLSSPTITGVATGAYTVKLSNGIGFFLAPTGTMADNGAYTSGTAFPRTIAKLYLYFAANQIAAGVAAGWYYATGSSTTVFTVFNNTYTSGHPTVPSSPTAFVTTGPGAITGTISEISALVVDLSAAEVGVYGGYRGEVSCSQTNNANVKTARVRLGGGAGTVVSTFTVTSSLTGWQPFRFWNAGAANSQILIPTVGQASAWGITGSNYSTGAVDLSAASSVHYTLQRATATDVLGFEGEELIAVKVQ